MKNITIRSRDGQKWTVPLMTVEQMASLAEMPTDNPKACVAACRGMLGSLLGWDRPVTGEEFNTDALRLVVEATRRELLGIRGSLD